MLFQTSAHLRICISAHLQLYLFVFVREEMELCDLVSRVAFNLYPLAVFYQPFHLAGYQALFNVGLNVRVYTKCNIFFVLLVKYVIEFVFNIIYQQNSWAYGARATTRRANLAGNNIHFRPHALTGYLH